MGRWRIGPIRIGGGRRPSFTANVGPLGITVGGRRKRKWSSGSYNDLPHQLDSSYAFGYDDGIDRSKSHEEISREEILRNEVINSLYSRHINLSISLFVTLVGLLVIPGSARFISILFGLLTYLIIAWRGVRARLHLRAFKKLPEVGSTPKNLVDPRIKKLRTTALAALVILVVWALLAPDFIQLQLFAAIVLLWWALLLSMDRVGRIWLRAILLVFVNYVWVRVWVQPYDSDWYSSQVPAWLNFFVLAFVICSHYYLSKLLWRYGRSRYPSIEDFEDRSDFTAGEPEFEAKSTLLNRTIDKTISVSDYVAQFFEAETKRVNNLQDTNQVGTSFARLFFGASKMDQRLAAKARESVFRDFFDAARNLDKSRIKQLSESEKFRGIIIFVDSDLPPYWKICNQEVFDKLFYQRVFQDKIINGHLLVPQADLTNANLADADLSGMNLIEVNLTGANLTRANLAGARLINANLSMANLTDANLAGTKLVGANLSSAIITKQQLSMAITDLAIMPDGTVKD